MGKPTYLHYMSYRLPYSKTIRSMTNIVTATAVMLNYFSMPRIMFLMSIINGSLFLTTLQAHIFCK